MIQRSYLLDALINSWVMVEVAGSVDGDMDTPTTDTNSEVGSAVVCLK